MIRIVLRADDLGYSVGVNYGIAWACDNGLPMSIGLMVNLPDVAHGYGLVADKGHCLGMHTTISAGRPVSDPADVPSLVDEDGRFFPSDHYRKAASDPATLADVEREAEAQYQAFVTLAGCEPDYVDVHAVGSANFVAGVRNVAKRHGKPFSYLAAADEVMQVGSSNALIHGSSGDLNALMDAVLRSDEQSHEPVAHLLMLHPGFVDAQLMRSSSLTIPRTTDAELLRSPELQVWAAQPGIELITYREL